MATMSHATVAVTNQHLETFHLTQMNDILGTWMVTLDKRFNGNERLTGDASTEEDLYVSALVAFVGILVGILF